jgi:hypothetical protein
MRFRIMREAATASTTKTGFSILEAPIPLPPNLVGTMRVA